jgi:hypothetical protein
MLCSRVDFEQTRHVGKSQMTVQSPAKNLSAVMVTPVGEVEPRIDTSDYFSLVDQDWNIPVPAVSFVLRLASRSWKVCTNRFDPQTSRVLLLHSCWMVQQLMGRVKYMKGIYPLHDGPSSSTGHETMNKRRLR